jgi:hypothetical protein
MPKRTSQRFSGVDATIEVTPRYHYGRHFVTLFPRQLMRLCLELTHSEVTVLLALLSNLRRFNFVALSTSEIASECHLASNHVSTALTNLRRAGAIIKRANGLFEVNPDVAWHGSPREWRGAEEKSESTHDRVRVMEGSTEVTTLWFPKPPDA